MIFQHIIAIASSYKLGKRIAWHYSDTAIDQDILIELRDLTRTLIGKPEYSIHKLSTDSISWESVVNKDSFFEGFKVYESLEEFLDIILEDKKISALDIAKLLLSIQSMSNLKLQKMVYFVYADYLTKTQKRLFDEKILAYKYGPVIEELYQYYKVHGSEKIEEEVGEKEKFDLKKMDEGKKVVLDEITTPVILAKILQSDDQKQILDSVISTFERFGSKTAGQLVSITHKEGSPWDVTPNYNDEITDDIILANHDVEISA